MKRSLPLIAVVVLVCGSVSSAFAWPTGSSNSELDYMNAMHDLSRWNCGIYYSVREREGSVLSVEGATLKTESVMGYVGYDALRWATIYFTAGGGTVETDFFGDLDNKGRYGLGLRLNLLDHEIFEPSLVEDRLRLTASFQYTMGELGTDGFAGQSDKFAETSGSIILSIINDQDANVLIFPAGISLFVGAIYSDLESDIIDEESTFGMIGGLEIFRGDRLSFELGAEYFDEEKLGFFAGVNLGL